MAARVDVEGREQRSGSEKATDAQAHKQTHSLVLTSISKRLPKHLHPMIVTSASHRYLRTMMHRPFTFVDRDWQWSCGLCAHIPAQGLKRVEIPVRTGTVVRWRVRFDLAPGLRWGDGSPVLAKDVRLGWRIGRLAATDRRVRRRLMDITEIKLYANEPRRLELFFRRAFSDFYQLDGLYAVPAHLEEEFWADSKGEVAEYMAKSLYVKSRFQPGLYQGPFFPTERSLDRASKSSFDRWLRRKRLRDPGWVLMRSFSRFASFQGDEQAPASRIVHQWFQPRQGLDIAEAVRRKVVNFVPEFQMKDITHSLLAGNAKRGIKSTKMTDWPEDLQYVEKPGLELQQVVFNLRNPKLARPSVRKALMHAIDVRKLNKDLLQDRGLLADGFLQVADPRAQWSFVEPYSTETAERLLDEAGWRLDEKDGKRKQGKQTFTLKITFPKGERLRLLLAQRLKQMWESLGLMVALDPRASRAYLERDMQRANFSSVALLASKLPVGSLPYDWLHSKSIPHSGNDYQGSNISGLSHPKIDRALDRLAGRDRRSQASELQASLELWRELQVLVSEAQPVVPLWFFPTGVLYPKDLKGLSLSGHQHPSSTSSSEWSIDHAYRGKKEDSGASLQEKDASDAWMPKHLPRADRQVYKSFLHQG